MGKNLLHLTNEELVNMLRDPVPEWDRVEHLRTCPDCRGELASSLLMGGLMRSERSADGSDHLSSTRIRDVHSAAYEFDYELKPIEFIAALQHMNACDRCYAMFFALHERLTPSERAVSGAIERFAKGQSKHKAGTLRITISRSFGLTQAFDSPIPPDGLVGLRSHISAAPSLMLGRLEEVAHSSRLMARQSVREPLSDDPWDILGVRAQTAAQALEEFVAKVVNLRKEARAAEWDGDDERLKLTLDELTRLQDRFAGVAVPLEEVRVRFQQVRDELNERLVEVRRRNQETYETDAEMIDLPGVALSVVSKWRGRSGSLEISAVDPETHEPRRGVEITPVATGGARSSSIKTDSQGRAAVPLGQQLVGLEIVVDPSDKPWVIDIALRNHTPRL